MTFSKMYVKLLWKECFKIDSRSNYKIFAALKLIEQLYIDGKIEQYIFKNILEEYKDRIDITQFEYSAK